MSATHSPAEAAPHPRRRRRELAPHERDQRSALAIARSRGRSGDDAGARRWLELAATFSPVTPKQRASVDAAILAGRSGLIIPGQLDLDGREHV